MAKIIIPEWSGIGKLEIEIEKGDLLLLKEDQHPKLGVFFDISKGKHFPYYEEFFLKTTFLLQASTKVLGGFCPALIAYLGDYHLNMRKLKGITVGQENIIQKLNSWYKYEPHAEWVAKLQRPY